jgi:NitT/TauT family transport system permease protein
MVDGRELRRERLVRSARQILVFTVFLVALAGCYTGYKAFGQAIEDRQSDWPVIGSILPRTDNLTMPPIIDIIGGVGETQRGTPKSLGLIIVDEAAFTLREAAVGFIVGVLIGLAIAILLVRSNLLERALTPYVVASQTIPLIAIAPIVVIWGRQNFNWLPWEWKDWMSVSIIATYLTFFPVAINGIRGLHSPSSENLELMSSYAAPWKSTLWKLRLPAALPYLFSAFRIAATASVVGNLTWRQIQKPDNLSGKWVAERYKDSV